MSIGENIRIIRKSKGLTMKELGKIIDVSEQGIGNYERGDREPNLDTIKKIADALDIQLSELLSLNLSNKTLFGIDELKGEVTITDITDDKKKVIYKLPGGKEAIEELEKAIMLLDIPENFDIDNSQPTVELEFAENIRGNSRKDIINQLNRIVSCFNSLHKCDSILSLHFYYSIDHLIDTFESMKDFIENQTTYTLEDYKNIIKSKLDPYPENSITQEKFEILKKRIENDMTFSKILALEKACPELYEILWK